MRAGVGLEFAAHIGLHGLLIDLDVVLPGADHGKVGARHGAYAAVGAAVELELEFVGEGGTVQLVLIIHRQLVAHILRVVAGILAAGLPQTGFGRAQVGAGAAEVVLQLVRQIMKDFFQLRGLRAQQHDVACGTVHVGDAGTAQIPDIAQLAQKGRVVEFGGGLGHAHGVKMRDAGEFFGLVAVTADNAAAVAEHAHNAAVLPVGFLVFVGKFQHAQQIVGSLGGNLVIQSPGIGGANFRLLLDVGDEARPGAAFKLIQQRSRMFCHNLPPWFLEHFQSEMLRVSNHTACRFAEKSVFPAHIWPGGAVPPPRVSVFSKLKRSDNNEFS